MYRPLDQQALWDRLRRHLAYAGPTPAAELYALLGVSPPTLSRMLSAHRSEIRSVGRARAVRHALRRRVGGELVEVPLYEVDADGATTFAGTMHPVEPAGFIVDGSRSLDGAYPGLPWFLDDLRPSGFLGRLVPRQHPELGFPPDVRDWSVDQSLTYMTTHGFDLAGNLIVGERAFQGFLSHAAPNPVSAAERASRYPALATDVMAAGVAGSSAGGEQPKFLATLEGRASVLVKFSPPMDSEHARRVADLLVCEHLAARTVARHGVAAAHTEVHTLGGRVFLEVHRFDRTPALGRRGVVSLRALDGEYVGNGRSWTAVCEALRRQGRIGESCLRRAVWLDRFGDWIGNTDKHLGNLSFGFQAGPLGDLCPVYDMLPMGYAPRAGELVDVTLALPTLVPTHTEAWWGSWRAGIELWGAVAEHPLVSESFRRIAGRNVQLLLEQEALLRRLPRDGREGQDHQ